MRSSLTASVRGIWFEHNSYPRKKPSSRQTPPKDENHECASLRDLKVPGNGTGFALQSVPLIHEPGSDGILR